jgi:hypothetical protein
MKSGLFLLGVVTCLTATIACAEQSKAHPVVEREVMFDGCHFKMADPYNGSLTLTTDGAPPLANYDATINPKASQSFETSIQFDCHNNITWSDLPRISGGGLAKSDGKWVIAFKDAKEVNMKLYTFHGKDWDGAGTTADQQDGDEDKRTRSFVFCLVHRSQALCGSDDTVMYLTHPTESVLPQILKLLESIEFIDTPSAKPAAASSSSSPPQ